MGPFAKLSKVLLLSFLILFALRSLVLAAQGFNAPDFRKYVKNEMEKWNVPGAAVLLIKDGKVIFSEGFGYRDRDNKLPVNSQTIFPIASCTKTFGSFTLGLLVDEGKIDWDTPIRKYYPELRMYEKYLTEHLTPRDILCHRSGLPRHDRVWMHTGLSRNDLMSRLRYLQPSFGFRERFQYNNIVYSLAGPIVEKLSKKKWEDFVKEHIFIPLGMNSSSLFVNDLKKTSNHSLPYIKSPEGTVKQIPFQAYNTTGPASCINSNLEDMAKWILLHINKGTYGKIRLMSEATIKEIHSPQMSIPTEGEFKPFICEQTPMLCYGLGWVVQPYKDHMMLNHSGGVDGFSSLIAFMPEEKTGVVVLTNLQTNMLPYLIAFNYFDRLYNDDQIDRGKKLREELETLLKEMQGDAKVDWEKNSSSPSRPLKAYRGTFYHPAYGKIAIILENNMLYSSYRNIKAPLYHLKDEAFFSALPFPSGDLNLRVTFIPDRAGRIASFTSLLQPGVDEIVFKKSP